MSYTNIKRRWITLSTLVLGIGFSSLAQPTVDRSFQRQYVQYPYKIETFDGEHKKEAWTSPLILSHDCKEGDRINLNVWQFTRVQIGESDEAIVYSPKRKIRINIPAKGEDKDITFFKNNSTIEVARANYSELKSYRNLAFNPYDFQETIETKDLSFPHVTTSSEYHKMEQFAGRNTIDGVKNNKAHGNWPDRSWGPEKESASWWKIDFGRTVEVDKINLLVRADFPHDSYWKSAEIVFDSGDNEVIAVTNSVEMQQFAFAKRATRTITLKNLTPAESDTWCAFTEVEVMGNDKLPFSVETSWEETVSSFQWEKGMAYDRELFIEELKANYLIETDWLMQDFGTDLKTVFANSKLEKSLKSKADSIAKANNLSFDSSKSNTEQYTEVRTLLRNQKLKQLENIAKRYVYVKRHRYTPSFFAYSEGLSDARSEFTFSPGGELNIMTIKDGKISEETILSETEGVLRDPDVSYDGKRILFSWKKSMKGDDYHLYEYDTESKEIRQITKGIGHADIEGKYLPNGEIVFNSTRCGQSVDCWKVEVSNLYFVNRNGKYMRRVGYDQVQTTYPTVTEQGTIIYTRWDYNDRGQTFPQPLFSMNMDGTMQRELYGNSSWYPTTITHARQVPGTSKIMATLCGHHTGQKGKLALIDPNKGRQENKGVTLLAPNRVEDPVRVDQYGQWGEQFQYPYPFSQNQFLVSYDPINSSGTQFGIYLMDDTGSREILAFDPSIDSKQIVPLLPRSKPAIRPSSVDYTKDTGVFYVQDVYYGEAVKGLERGTIEKLRVVELDFRTATVGWNDGSGNEEGVGVANIAGTPIALAMGAWDVKRILGEVKVEKDGSTMFEVPAHTPVYFQLIDKEGNVAQTMRSWSSLQPGETFGCVGCHEDKNESVPLKKTPIAMRKKVQKLEPFHDLVSGEGFSYRKEIQPIWDKHCVSCHYDRESKRLQKGSKSVADFSPATNASKTLIAEGRKDKKAFSLLDNPVESKKAKRNWNDSYMNLLSAKEHRGSFQGDYRNDLVNWPGMQSVPTLLPIYYKGASTSKLLTILKENHGGVELEQQELDKIACWIDLQVPYCGDYYEANTWSEEDKIYYKYYQDKRDKAAEDDKQNIEEFIQSL